MVVDLDINRITTSEDIPPVPEPEYSSLRGEILKLLCPNVVGIDSMKAHPEKSLEQNPKARSRLWGQDHDLQLR